MIARWLKRTMPRSLFGRALLGVVLPVVLLLLIISVSFAQRHFEGVTRQMTRSVLLEVRYLVERVAAAPSLEKAQAEAMSVAGPLEFAVTYPVEDAPVGDFKLYYDLSGGFVIEQLHEGLHELIAVHLVTDRDVEMWISMPLGTMQVSFARSRLSASNPHQLLVMIIVLGALMIAVVSIFLRSQLQPLHRLSIAAADYGRGRVAPYQPSGALELRAAGTAFLDMRNRIERQSQSRTLMLSGISHDLRTPLTRLRLGLSMLDDADTEPLVRDVDDMQRLIDAFLDFARDEASDVLEEVAPGPLVAEIVEDCARAGAQVEFDPPAKPPGDMHLRPMGVRRAVENLIGNAMRYGTNARVSVVDGAAALTIIVEDDGPGIAAADREEAVRPFTRLDPSRNQDSGPGVGLGLAIVTDVARAHGGALRLGDSAELGGLKAELVLPR